MLTPPALLSLRLWWDVAYPREWDTPGRDPCIYGWGLAFLWLLVIAICDGILRHERRLARKARTRQLLAHAEKLMREKQFASAEACLAEAKALTGQIDPTDESPARTRRTQ
jgi:uncharacterized membrane protein YcjF (UPF0283 family)